MAHVPERSEVSQPARLPLSYGARRPCRDVRAMSTWLYRDRGHERQHVSSAASRCRGMNCQCRDECHRRGLPDQGNLDRRVHGLWHRVPRILDGGGTTRTLGYPRAPAGGAFHRRCRLAAPSSASLRTAPTSSSQLQRRPRMAHDASLTPTVGSAGERTRMTNPSTGRFHRSARGKACHRDRTFELM
jgi:hypothetical protein